MGVMNLAITIKDIILVLIGGVLGGFASWAVGHFYYRKSALTDEINLTIMNSISSGLRGFVRATSLYNFFSTSSLEIQQEPTYNSLKAEDGIPQVMEVRIDKKFIAPGDNVGFLIRVVDRGFDFDPNNGIKVEDWRNNSLKMKREGFGYFTTYLSIPKDVLGRKQICIFLEDEKGNKNQFKCSFRVRDDYE